MIIQLSIHILMIQLIIEKLLIYGNLYKQINV
ncbi:hypothetical protein KSF78_0008669 [Schistosoma japonicum]|nr:hypothetical protein KSF78_0008669 [Schistosoma japonicum]